MANQGDQTVYIGNNDWFRGDPVSFVPVTVLNPTTVRSMVGGYVRLDGSESHSLDGEDTLYFEWSLLEVPTDSQDIIGSLNPGPYTEWVDRVLTKEVNNVGRYRYSLQVRGANGGYGNISMTFVISTVSNSPLFDNISLDSSWLWQVLPDFWRTMPFEDRHKLEVIWRGVSQTVGADLLNLYSIDNDKSIATIQEKKYSRWSSVSLALYTRDYPIRINQVRSAPVSFLQDLDGGGTATGVLDISELPQWEDIRNNLITKFSATILSNSEISPIISSRDDFFPTYADIGSKIEIIIGDIKLSTEVTYVEFNWRGNAFSSRYIIKDPLSIESVGINSNTIVCILNRPYSNILPLPVILEGDSRRTPALLNSYDKQTNRITLSQAVGKVGIHTSLKAYPSVIIPNADLEGISVGDDLYLGIEREGSSFKSAVKVAIKGIIETERTNDEFYVMFDSITSTFSDLGDSIAKQLHPDSEEEVDTFNQLISTKSFRHRVESGLINNINVKTSVFILSIGTTTYRYRVYPIKILRTTKVGLTSDVTNVIKLSEFIENHEVDGAGSIRTDGNRSRFLRREPLFLLENKDFYIQGSKIKGYNLEYSTVFNESNTALFSDEGRAFTKLGVAEGDMLEIPGGLGKGDYTITSVEDGGVRVIPIPSISVLEEGLVFTNTKYFIRPKTLSKVNPYRRYVIFNSDVLKVTTPDKLWVETQVESNDKAIELNFGHLVSFPYEEWVSRQLTTSYKSTVAGLLSARVMGSSIDSIKRAIGIVSGIPYAEERSRVLFIDKKAEMDGITGIPTRVKVVVEGLDSDNRSNQNIRSYTLPAQNIDTDPKSSGLALGTGLDGRLKVGDELSQFDLLGLGIVIEDIISETRGRFDPVKDRHRFRVTINYDSTEINTAEDIQFLYDFVLDIKPSYVEFILSFLKYLVDYIEIKSRVRFKYKTSFFDNGYLLRGPADIYDDEIPGRSISNAPTYNVLSTWFPNDGIVTINPGTNTLNLYSSTGYFSTERLNSGAFVTSILGNDIYTRHNHYTAFNEVDGDIMTPWIRGESSVTNRIKNGDINNGTIGTLPDYVTFRGKNKGVYRIIEVNDDYNITLEPLGPSGESLSLFEEESVPFVVVRLVTEIIYDGILHEEGASGVYLLGEGILNDGLAAYDELGFVEDSVNRYIIEEFIEGATDLSVPAIFVHPSQTFPKVNHDFPTRVIVRRPQLATRERGSFFISKVDSDRGSHIFKMVSDVNSPTGLTVNPVNFHACGINVGDEVKFYLGVNNSEYTSIVVGIFGAFCWLNNSFDIPFGEHIEGFFYRPSALFGEDSLDQPDKMIHTGCNIIFRSTNREWNPNIPATQKSYYRASISTPYKLKIVNLLSDSSDQVILSLKAGDLLKVYSLAEKEGVPSEDFTLFTFDEGDGILRIVEVDEGTVLLAQPLPISGDVFIDMSFDVKIIKQSNLTSVYWRN